ncbi:pseudaminic acid synthase [Gracilimonas sp.]|uniref:pseudaminic acid synthase n=1 Tax=Gracilimonas sp. TaxID=1974203 RepID=UPI003BABD246
MKEFKIDDFVISENSKPFIIAEMSGNHNQSLDRALEIVDAAAEAGAHGLKIQTYTADTMTIQHDEGLFFIDDPDSLWHGKTLYDLYEIAHTPWEWHEPIFERAKSKGLIPFSTPFDNSSVDFLEELNVPVYKVASFENKDWPLLKKIASTGKPVIMSTGASTLSDISESVAVLRENGCTDLVLLKCTSTYPASAENTNLKSIPYLKELFNCYAGLSDHTRGVGAALASVSLGAKVIEKHFTLSREDGGVDSAFSIEPPELKILVDESERAWKALGDVKFDILKDEKGSLRFKRSLYVVKDVKKGEEFSQANVRVIRPGDGMAPKYYEKVIGKIAKQDIKRATALTWDLL